MKQRIFAILLSLTMMFTLVPTAWAEDAEGRSAETPIIAEGGELAAGNYILPADIDLMDDLVIPSGADVTIDLNGHTLKGTGTGSVITVEGTLNIRDGASVGSITGGNAGNGGGILVKNGGRLVLVSGAICHNTAKAGGGVYVEAGGYFEMTGGKISYNISTNVRGAGGGGVAIDDGAEFNLSSGKISNNTSYIQGGGVFTNGTMNMSGGEISENKAPAGAGVITNKNSFTMTAGAIKNNVANCEDNITHGGKFNHALGGGVKAANSTFNFYGGEISGNRVEATDLTSLNNVTSSITEMGMCDGGGIHVRDSAEIHVKGTPVVKDNTNVFSATNYADNIYFQHANVLLELDGNLENGASLPIYKAGNGQITFCGGYFFADGTITSDRDAVSFVKRGKDLFVGESVNEDVAICYTITNSEKYYYASLDAMAADLVAGTHDVYLTKDVQLTNTVKFSNKANLTLRPDSGKTIKITYPNANGAFFTVPTGSTLTVCGAITLDGSSVTTKNARAFDVSGTLTIGENGTADVPVIQNFAPANTNGGAVNVSSGTLNIYSGKLTNNTAGAMGGAIYATRDSVVNMTGGTIASNRSTSYGGGICVDTSILNISGGSITNNTAGNNVGHGVHLFSDSILNMDGGSVMNNSETASQISVNHSCAKFVSGEVGTVRNAGAGIIFYTNGGDFENCADLTQLPTPSKNEYRFDGWYTQDGTSSGEWGTKMEGTVTADKTYYAKWVECNHTNTSYTAKDNVITEACGCGHISNTLTLNVPTNLTYDGSKKECMIEKSSGWKDTSEPVVAYYSGENKLDEAPVNAGNYTAKVTVQGATASVDFTIIQAKPTVKISADQTSLTGSGTVKLTVTSNGVPEKGTVTVTCDNGITVTKNADGTFAALPNETKTYTFTASYAGDDNHKEATDTCRVSVTRRSSSGGSSSSGSSYAVSAPSAKNGDVTVSPKNASKGDRVTVTVKPDSGYEVGSVTVLDSKGNELKLTDKGNGKYTFTMPGGKVEVKATFVKAGETSPFVDVPADSYYFDAVKWAQKLGITNGKTDVLFGANDPCTRGQIVTFLWRAAGSPAPKGTAKVPGDVLPGSYCYDAVAWAIENGVTNGFADGTFGVNSTCTRGQSVTFLYRALGTAPTTVNGFTDVAAGDFYAEAVAWAVENGVTNGTTDSTFSPSNGCTCAQIVTFLYRAKN